MERKHITLREEQVEWIKENHIILSSFVQKCIKLKMGDSQ